MKTQLRVWKEILGPLMIGCLALSPIIKAADRPDSEEVSKLLSEAKTQAFDLKEDAAAMESFTRQDVAWETHADRIAQIRDCINKVGRQVAKLDAARDAASPWQITAIDRIKPLLSELAANTKNVIEVINREPKKINSMEYKEYLEANSDEAAHLAALISEFADYGKMKQRLEKLSNKLEAPTT